MDIGTGDFLIFKIPPPRGLGYSLFQREIFLLSAIYSLNNLSFKLKTKEIVVGFFTKFNVKGLGGILENVF